MIDEGDLAGPPGVEIALENISGEIVFARDRREHRVLKRARLSDIHRALPPLDRASTPSRSRSLVEHDLFRKPAATFPDHARWAEYGPPLAHERHYAADRIWPQLDRQTGCQESGIAL